MKTSMGAKAPLALLLLACASTTPHGLLRVELPGPGAGPASPAEVQLASALRDGAGAEGLVCQPGAGSSLLRCTPLALGEGHALTVDLDRSGTGYAVKIDQAFSLPGRESPVCDVQRRLADRIDSELALPVTRVDNRSDCKPR